MIAPWSGKSNMFGMKNYQKFFHGEVHGNIEEGAPLQESPGHFNWAQIRCQISMNIDPKTKAPDFVWNVHDDHPPTHTRSFIPGAPARAWRKRPMENSPECGDRPDHRDFRHHQVSVPHGNRGSRIRSHPRCGHLVGINLSTTLKHQPPHFLKSVPHSAGFHYLCEWPSGHHCGGFLESEESMGNHNVLSRIDLGRTVAREHFGLVKMVMT